MVSPVFPPSSPPRLRGRSHQVAFFVALVAGAALVVTAPPGRARVADSVYALALTSLFGVSALLHRRIWSAPARKRMRLLDRCMIYVAIAGTYTPIGVRAVTGTLGTVVLWLVWAGALIGIVLQPVPLRAPKWAVAIPYLGMGWLVVLALPEMGRRLGVVGLGLVMLGGLLYSLGALVYGRQRPDPRPAVFGYHEVFHAFVVAAAACHYVVIAFYL